MVMKGVREINKEEEMGGGEKKRRHTDEHVIRVPPIK